MIYPRQQAIGHPFHHGLPDRLFTDKMVEQYLGGAGSTENNNSFSLSNVQRNPAVEIEIGSTAATYQADDSIMKNHHQSTEQEIGVWRPY